MVDRSCMGNKIGINLFIIVPIRKTTSVKTSETTSKKTSVKLKKAIRLQNVPIMMACLAVPNPFG